MKLLWHRESTKINANCDDLFFVLLVIVYVVPDVPLRSTPRKTTMDMQMQSQEKELKEGHGRKSKWGIGKDLNTLRKMEKLKWLL